MKIIKRNKIGVAVAIKVLRAGGVVVYPTDTAYALGGIFNSPKVITKVLKIKKRSDRKFTLVAASLYQVEKFFKLNQPEKKLARKFWPGPLSIAVSAQFAVRVPKDKIARELARGAGRPLIATSANLTGGQTYYDSEKIIKQFIDKKFQPDLVVNAGKLSHKKTSTIVKVSGSKIEIVRSGAVSRQKIYQL